VKKWETCFWFSTFCIRYSRRAVWNVGIAERSKDCGKRGVLSSSPSFPQAWVLVGGRLGFCFLGLLDSIAWNVELENHAMVNKAVDRSRSGHRIFEDPFPLGERQIAGDEDAAALVAFRLNLKVN